MSVQLTINAYIVMAVVHGVIAGLLVAMGVSMAEHEGPTALLTFWGIAAVFALTAFLLWGAT